MNKIVLMGRLTRNPEIRYSQGNDPMCIARFTLAVDRRFKKEGEQNADFPSCVAFGKTAQFFEKYVQQGTKICLEGHIQTGSYTKKDGSKAYTTDVVVDAVEFAESKNAQAQPQQNQPYQPQQQAYQTPQAYQAPQQPYQPSQGYQPQQQSYQPQQTGQMAYRSPMEQFQQPQQQYQQQQFQQQTMAQQNGFMNVPPMDDEGLPFGD